MDETINLVVWEVYLYYLTGGHSFSALLYNWRSQK